MSLRHRALLNVCWFAIAFAGVLRFSRPKRVLILVEIGNNGTGRFISVGLFPFWPRQL
jgi:hypothetical protein